MDGLSSISVRQWYIYKHPRDVLIRSTKGFISGVLGYVAMDFAISPYVTQTASCLFSCSFPEATKIGKDLIILSTLAVSSVMLARSAITRTYHKKEAVASEANTAVFEKKTPEPEPSKKDSE